MKKIILIPKLINELGGPGSFQKRLTEYFKNKNIQFSFNLNESQIEAVLLINGTRHFLKILKYSFNGTRIVQRLGSPMTLQGYLKVSFFIKIRHSIIQNYLAFIRRYFASHVVYQSEFVKKQWDLKHGHIKTDSSVIYNGTDLNIFKQVSKKYVSNKKFKIISVEGSQGNDPFEIALNLGKELNKRRNDFEILLIGKISNNIRKKFSHLDYIKIIGKVSQSDLPYYYSSGDLYLLTDIIQAGCPNSAIEAMACGLPVVSYNVGPITELVHDNYSSLIDVENDPWLGNNPGNMSLMANAVEKIFIKKNSIIKEDIIKIVSNRFSFDNMSENYLNILKL